MHLSLIVALVGVTLGLVQATSNSASGNTLPLLVHLQSRDNKHHKHHHNKKHHNIKEIDENVYPLYRKRRLESLPSSFEKRSTRNDYDRAIKYMEKAKKSYERAQRQNRGSRRYRGTQSTNYLQTPNRFSKPRRQRPINDGYSRYDQSLQYAGRGRNYNVGGRKNGDRGYPVSDSDYFEGIGGGYNEVGTGYTSGIGGGYNEVGTGYTSGIGVGYNEVGTGYSSGSGSRGFESPPLPPTGSPPPTPVGDTGGGGGVSATAGEGGNEGTKEGGGEEGSDSEIKEWGLKDGKIPTGADIEEEDAPDPEQDPSDATDPPIVDGKPVAREE